MFIIQSIRHMLEDTHAFPVIPTLLSKLFIQRGETTLLSSWPSPSFLICTSSVSTYFEISPENTTSSWNWRRDKSSVSKVVTGISCSVYSLGKVSIKHFTWPTVLQILIGILMVQAWHLWCIWLANQSSRGCYHQDRL